MAEKYFQEAATGHVCTLGCSDFDFFSHFEV